MDIEFSRYLQQCDVSDFFSSVTSTLTSNVDKVKRYHVTPQDVTRRDMTPSLLRRDVLRNATSRQACHDVRPVVMLDKKSDNVKRTDNNNRRQTFCSNTTDVVQRDKASRRHDLDVEVNIKQRPGRSQKEIEESISTKCRPRRAAAVGSDYDNKVQSNESGQGRDGGWREDIDRDDDDHDDEKRRHVTLRPCLRQMSLPVRLWRAADQSHGDTSMTSSPRRRRRSQSVKFADEIGELLSTVVFIPSRLDNDNNNNNNNQNNNNNDNDSNNESDNTDVHRRTSAGGCEGAALLRSQRYVTSSRASVTPHRSFTLGFEPPTNNFDSFLSKLHSQHIALESVKLTVIVENNKTLDGTIAFEEGDQRRGVRGRAGCGAGCEAGFVVACGVGGGHIMREGVKCNVKVMNIDPHKRVFVRLTSDNWTSWKDVDARYVDDGTGAFTTDYDTFRFTLPRPFLAASSSPPALPSTSVLGCPDRHPASPSDFADCHDLIVSQSSGSDENVVDVVEFAICYQVKSLTCWDNNEGRNYKIIWS